MRPTSQKIFIRRLRRVYGVKVLTRSEWGTRHKSLYWRRNITHRAKPQSDTLVEHISVTHDDGKLIGHFVADMQELERIGYSRFKSGISYNIAIDRVTGMVGIGQNFRAKGTHTVNNKKKKGYSFDQNFWARAICWIGVPGDKWSNKCRDSHVKVISCMMDCGFLTEHPDYLPHSYFAYKECPMDYVARELNSILRDAQALHAKMKRVKTPRK